MIPKKIHYCWFGGNPLSELAEKCIASWKKYCPDFEIIEWNESNFDINCCDYVREAYEAQKWAFVSDVARLYALVNYGGIYMDTDVEVLKSLDDILSYEAIAGFEAKDRVQTALMGCVEGQTLFQEILHSYDDAHFLKTDGSLDTTTNVTRITSICSKYGLKLDDTLQTVNGLTLFPHHYFCPKDYETRVVKITENTYALHHFDGSWLSEEEKYAAKIYEKYGKFLPKIIVSYAVKFCVSAKFKGFAVAIREVCDWTIKNVRKVLQ